MQRYHLPFIGKILSPGDSGLRFSNVPPSAAMASLLTTFLFENAIFTPPTSGIAAHARGVEVQDNPTAPQTSGVGEATNSMSAASEMIPISGIMEALDFPIACTLITHWFGFGRCRRFPPGLGTSPATQGGAPTSPLNPGMLEVQYSLHSKMRQHYVDNHRRIVTAPYEIFPRRLWDLKVNRVIPVYLFQLPWNTDTPCSPEYVAISHSWVKGEELEYIYTPINQGAWPVPVPKGVELELIRNEVLGHFPSSRYCWLDILCLRQPCPWPKDRPGGASPLYFGPEPLLESLELGQDPTGERHTDEIGIDVPTIGNVYKNAVGVLRYFNGLGKPFHRTGWDDPHHWLNRAWTLQESTPRMMNGGILDAWSNPLNTISMWRGISKKLRELLHEVEGLGTLNPSRGIIGLAREMGCRRASKEIDKIAGLSYLLHFEELPLYSQNESVEQGWRRCLQTAPVTVLAELFFNCPFTGLFGIFPTWAQLRDSPEPFVKLRLPNASSVFRVPNREIRAVWELGESVPKELNFFGYKMSAYIRKGAADQESNSYLAVVQPKPEPLYPGMSVNLRFFPLHDTELNWGGQFDGSIIYSFFTHSLVPCSSWVVLHEGTKVGVLCSDEVFVGMHRSQIVEKGALVAGCSECGGHGGWALSCPCFPNKLAFVPGGHRPVV